MRRAETTVLSALVGAWALCSLALAAGPRGETPATVSARAAWLEIPSFGPARYPAGVLEIPEPHLIEGFSIHVPVDRAAKVFLRVNAKSLGLVQEVRQKKGKIVCSVDFSRHGGASYSFRPGTNTVEIEVDPGPGRSPIYSRWIVASPADPAGWARHEAVALPQPSSTVALGADGIVVLEGSSGQALGSPGLTVRDTVTLQAAFSKWTDSVGLRARHVDPQGHVRVLSEGALRRNSGRGVERTSASANRLELEVPLHLGVNQIEAEILHGDAVVFRSHFRVSRRRSEEPGEITGRRWAVVIGTSQYQDPAVVPLRYADRDAEALAELLVTDAGFEAERVRLLVNENATLAAMRSALFDFLLGTKPEDLVLIFVAGHGVYDPRDPDNYYFLANDSKLQVLGGTALPMWDLSTAMGHSIRAENVVVFADTCHSGGSLGYDSAEGPGLNFVNAYLQTLASRRGRAVLAAGQAHEQSLELDRLGHGAFTFHLLRGLRGAADIDRDSAVTLGELFEYVEAAVPEETEGAQHPSSRLREIDPALRLVATGGSDRPRSRGIGKVAEGLRRR